MITPKKLLVLPCRAFAFRIVLQPRIRPRPPGRCATLRGRSPRLPSPGPRPRPVPR